MKSAIIERTYDSTFAKVYDTLRDNITANGFLLLHEIDTQKIVSKHGVIISPLRQLLFFHPKYIEVIVKHDALAINEIPIKLVVFEKKVNQISVSYPNPILKLKDYALDSKLSLELLYKVEAITDF